MARASMLASAAFVLIACGGADQEWSIEREVELLKMRTIPHEGRLIAATGPRREGLTATAMWELAAKDSWEEYETWLLPRMRVTYQAIPAGPQRLVMRRYTVGDVFEVQLELVSTGPPAHIRVRFIARPH